jgi:hypothetical protein
VSLVHEDPGLAAAPRFAPDETGPADDLATAEAYTLGAGDDLERNGKLQEHQRHQTFRNHVNRATLILFWLIVVCVGLGVFVYSWHLVTPLAWHWLDGAAREKLQTLLAAALLSSALTGYVNRRLA